MLTNEIRWIYILFYVTDTARESATTFIFDVQPSKRPGNNYKAQRGLKIGKQK